MGERKLGRINIFEQWKGKDRYIMNIIAGTHTHTIYDRKTKTRYYHKGQSYVTKAAKRGQKEY